MAIEIRPLTASVGAELSSIDVAALSNEDFAAVKRAWYAHSVLVIRDQAITDDDLLVFSHRFGELDPPPNQENGKQSPPGFPDIYVVSNILDENGKPIGALGAGEASWHTDMSYVDLPPDASMLYALEIPKRGGNTWFCGMQAACAQLPAALRSRIVGRRIKHDGTYNSGGYLRQGVQASDDPSIAPGAWHPANIVHPVFGIPSLYLGRRRNSVVEGMSRAESDTLLDDLWAFVTEPAFCYEHRWRAGDLVMWDNRSTMHRRDPFDATQRRLMHRTQIRGTQAPKAYVRIS